MSALDQRVPDKVLVWCGPHLQKWGDELAAVVQRVEQAPSATQLD